MNTNVLSNACIQDIGSVIGGGTPAKKNKDYWNGNIPWLSPKDLSKNPLTFTKRGANNISKLGLDNSSTKLLPSNSVLYSSRAPIGYISIAKNNIATNQGFKSIIPNKNYPYWFIYELLKFETSKIINEASGSTFKEISGSRLKQHQINIPSQNKIMNKDQTFNSIFNKIKQLESETTLLKDLRDTLLRKYF